MNDDERLDPWRRKRSSEEAVRVRESIPEINREWEQYWRLDYLRLREIESDREMVRVREI